VNLDSLMDALTNVVAVLILVLILVQADVTKKVVEFLQDLQPATPEQVEQSRIDLATITNDLETRRKLMQKEPPSPEEIEEEKRLLSLLEKKIKDNTALLADLDALRKLEATLRKSRDAEQKETRHIQDEIARLEALLDATPVLEVPPPAEVTIPRSRPIPKTADVYYALAFNDRVHLIDRFTPLKIFQKEFQRHKREWEHQRIKRQGADRYIYDPVKIVAHFKGFDFGNERGQSVTLGHNPISTRLYIDIRPNAKEGGTSTGELAKFGMKAPFGKAMDHLTQKRDAVIMFWVNPNSFNTYLVARRAADKAGVPAGWDVRGNTFYRFTIPEVEVRRLKEPPPPDPNAKPPAPRPPPLKPKLD
jgi:hypothetical protein